jgi:NodT family efflux transporter outer membrane factor (OMF) lipoprotein
MDVPQSPAMSRARTHSALGLLAPLVLGVASCAVGPNFVKPKPQVPEQWSASATTPGKAAVSTVTPTAPQAVEWWASFEDPTLTSLVERSAGANLDVRAAVLRIEEARAQRDVTASGLWPSFALNASYSRNLISENTPNGVVFGITQKLPLPPGVSITNPYSQYQFGATASWELDLFGRVRRSVEAADADTATALEQGHDVLISMLGEVGRAYIGLRGAQLRVSIVEHSLATQRDLLALTRDRRDAGLTTDLDVANAESEVSATEAELPLLEREITDDVNQLSQLMAREPEALRAELGPPRAVPPVPPVVPIGLPADLARRRPDIRRSEASLHAATARVGVAVADLFPRVTLTGAGGWQSQGLSRLIEVASRFGSIGPTIELPIFEGGRQQATIRLENVRAQEAAVDYARTVLGALHEVENALAAYNADQTRRVSLQSAVVASRDALTLARQRYESGVTSFIDVLTADRTLEQNELALAETTTAVSTDLVLLYKTLGGGWDSQTLKPAS